MIRYGKKLGAYLASVLWLSGCVTWDATTETKKSGGRCSFLSGVGATKKVGVCDLNSDVIFYKYDGSVAKIAKKTLEAKVTAQVRDYLLEENLVDSFFQNGRISVFFNFNELRPSEQKLNVVVNQGSFGFAFQLPLEIEHWNIRQAEMYTLANRQGSESQYWFAGKLQLTRFEHVSVQTWRRFLRENNLSFSEPVASTELINIAKFREKKEMKRIKSHPEYKYIVASLMPLQAQKSIDSDYMLFSLPFSLDKNELTQH